MKIRLVEDNLNTQTINAFYEHFPADQAFSLAQRFEFYHTPISASWLNMIEIEFSSLARLCLNRRIPTLEKLEHELLAFFKDRNLSFAQIGNQIRELAAKKQVVLGL